MQKQKKGGLKVMRKKNYKGRCEKRTLGKSKDVCRLYDEIQGRYADRLQECVFRKYLTKPMTVRLLDASRIYWLNHGVSDWGLVIDAEK